MFENVKWICFRRRRIKHLCYDVWGWCKAKNKFWKKMTRVENAKSKLLLLIS